MAFLFKILLDLQKNRSRHWFLRKKKNFVFKILLVFAKFWIITLVFKKNPNFTAENL
jgi:hypothetical protein